MNDCKHENRTIDCKCNDCGYDFIVDPMTEKIRLQEQERIIKLLEEQITKCPCEPECQTEDPVDVSDLIALIKGEK